MACLPVRALSARAALLENIADKSMREAATYYSFSGARHLHLLYIHVLLSMSRRRGQ